MIKFLKFLLFVIIIIFAFALGVKFSDSFKSTTGNLKNDEMQIENNIQKAVDNDMNADVNPNSPEVQPLSEEESNMAPAEGEIIFEQMDMELIEPMDGVYNMSNDAVNQDANMNNFDMEQRGAPVLTQTPSIPETPNSAGPIPVIVDPNVPAVPTPAAPNLPTNSSPSVRSPSSPNLPQPPQNSMGPDVIVPAI